MDKAWKDTVYQQRALLAQSLHAPMAQLAERCVADWHDPARINAVLAEGFPSIPHAKFLWTLGDDGIQISDNIAASGIVPGYRSSDRTPRPYMREPVPAWGFLLSDAYVSLSERPSLTALHVVRDGERFLGYLGATFDLRNLPSSATTQDEPDSWRQIRGDPSIRGTVFLQQRTESPMDQHIDKALSILGELIAERGMFQVVIHFSSSRATGWFVDDPYRYRLIDHEALADPDVCLLYPRRPWPIDALIPRDRIRPILDSMRELRLADVNLYLRSASINIFNGMISVTFSCDGSHYMGWEKFLDRHGDFWVGLKGRG